MFGVYVSNENNDACSVAFCPFLKKPTIPPYFHDCLDAASITTHVFLVHGYGRGWSLRMKARLNLPLRFVGSNVVEHLYSVAAGWIRWLGDVS